MVKLTPQDKELITRAIEQAEQNSSGEIVTAITEQSGDWRALSLAIAVAVGFMLSLSIWYFTAIHSYLLLCIIQLAGLITADFLLLETGLVTRLVPQSLRIPAAARNAHAQFFERGLHTTPNRAAILIFFSHAEEYAEIIPDIGIRTKEPDSIWQDIAYQFMNDKRQTSLSNAFVKAINHCAAIQQKHFPTAGRNANTLPNHIIEFG